MSVRVTVAVLTVVGVMGLASARGLAAPLPQELETTSNAAPPKSDEQVQREKNPEVESSAVRDGEFSSSSQHSVRSLGADFLEDQRQIWSSPSKLRFSDAQWLVPFSGIAAGLFVTDSDFSSRLSRNPTTMSHYSTLSDAGIAGLVGGAGGMWLLGHVRHNEHWSETGFLAGEAALNSLVLVEGLKYSLRRERPFQGDGSGSFFQSGGTSFPSEHAAAAWSVAGVIAHEYPGPLPKIMAYGLASLVDYSRIHARQHFPSDVFVGSIIGNLVAQNIYSRHHDPELGGGEWRSIGEFFRGEDSHSPRNQGSPYVPLDSWVYPAFERLAALGYVKSGIFGMRPWTRLECVRLLNEAGENLDRIESEDTEAILLHESLAKEFSNDIAMLAEGNNQNLQIESVYTRATEISGTPLVDGYHFGQTITNDFGRPYAEGFNTVEGFSGWASEGRLTAYIRGEYQHTPSSPALSAQARQFIAGADGAQLPVPPNTGNSAADHLELLDAYLAVNLDNWQVSFGKQSLWWGPSEGGPLLLSDNAAPITMFRVNRVSPFKLPSFLGRVGPIRLEFFMGQLTGQHFIFINDTNLVGQWGSPLGRQPFIHGEKISFKPTSNFEFSLCETTVFAGGPIPLTVHNLYRAYTAGFFSQSSVIGDITSPRSGIDFTYRVPWVRKWLTFYGDAFTTDEITPLKYPRKSVFQGGIYMPRIPGISKLDLRVEGGSTSPVDFYHCIGCFYQNSLYPQAYTNGGNLMGSWIGRASQGEQAWSTYWLTSKNTIQFNYRHRKIDGQFLPHGGTVNDGGVRADFWLGPTIRLTGAVQYEKWNVPILDPLVRSNVMTSVEVSFWPRRWGLQAR